MYKQKYRKLYNINNYSSCFRLFCFWFEDLCVCMCEKEKLFSDVTYLAIKRAAFLGFPFFCWLFSQPECVVFSVLLFFFSDSHGLWEKEEEAWCSNEILILLWSLMFTMYIFRELWLQILSLKAQKLFSFSLSVWLVGFWWGAGGFVFFFFNFRQLVFVFYKLSFISHLLIIQSQIWLNLTACTLIPLHT